ncbi:hypothetical protein HK099_003637 [Clydaea vesicula]|uniref:Uncharacterized protein n=1 Tax=Clydaea vesicula TaxID=447962 RepID=A0AAD5U8B8_9FUNG|nr:hypothetical protein HK099_003637 [Clydaea vesicula]
MDFSEISKIKRSLRQVRSKLAVYNNEVKRESRKYSRPKTYKDKISNILSFTHAPIKQIRSFSDFLDDLIERILESDEFESFEVRKLSKLSSFTLATNITKVNKDEDYDLEQQGYEEIPPIFRSIECPFLMESLTETFMSKFKLPHQAWCFFIKLNKIKKAVTVSDYHCFYLESKMLKRESDWLNFILNESKLEQLKNKNFSHFRKLHLKDNVNFEYKFYIKVIERSVAEYSSVNKNRNKLILKLTNEFNFVEGFHEKSTSVFATDGDLLLKGNLSILNLLSLLTKVDNKTTANINFDAVCFKKSNPESFEEAIKKCIEIDWYNLLNENYFNYEKYMIEKYLGDNCNELTIEKIHDAENVDPCENDKPEGKGWTFENALNVWYKRKTDKNMVPKNFVSLSNSSDLEPSLSKPNYVDSDESSGFDESISDVKAKWRKKRDFEDISPKKTYPLKNNFNLVEKNFYKKDIYILGKKILLKEADKEVSIGSLHQCGSKIIGDILPLNYECDDIF